MKTYSFTKGLGKGLTSVLVLAISLVTLAGFADLPIWELLETYIKPIIGYLTVGGVLTMALNWIKVKTSA